MRFPRLTRPFALMVSALAVGCGSSPATPTTPAMPSRAPLHELVSATLAPTSVMFASVGQTAQVVVTGTFNDGTTQDITTSTGISSSNDNVATVAQSGLVTAWASGTATLTVTYQWPPPNSTPNPSFEAGQSLHTTGAVTVLSGPPNNPVLVPTLLSPMNGAVLPNACRPINCPEPTWTFTWSPVPGAAFYHILVMHSGAEFPIVDATGMTSTTYAEVQSGDVANNNLQGWQWMVQASVNGVYQAWSAAGTFSIAPATNGSR